MLGEATNDDEELDFGLPVEEGNDDDQLDEKYESDEMFWQ